MISYSCDRCRKEVSAFSCEGGQSFEIPVELGAHERLDARIFFERADRSAHLCEPCAAVVLRALAAAIPAYLTKVGL